MNLMLLLLFMSVVLGLTARRWGPREHLVVGLLSVTTTGLYFFFGRFM